MSRQMKNFADYFMQGMQMGAGWAEKWQAGQIASARNKIMQERNAAVDKRENAKLGLYGEQVRANAELAKARAFRALNPVAKGGKGGGAAPSDADAAALRKEAADRGIISAPPAPAPQQNVTNNYTNGDSDGGGTTDAAPPVEAGYGDDGMAKGGMVRPKRYAEGGIVGGMSLQEAQSYQGAAPREEASRSRPSASSAFSGAMASAAKYKPKEDKTETPKPEVVTPRGPVGSGAGGSYTTADVQSGGVLDTRYRAGGMVPPRSSDPSVHRGYRPKVRDEPARQWREPEDVTGQDERFISGAPRHVPQNDSGSWYAEGGAVQSQDLTQGYDYKAAEKERETQTQRAQTEQVAQTAQQAEEEQTSRSRRAGGAGSNFSSSFASSFDSGSANGATGSGGDSAGGVSGSGGVGGSATGGAGGSAAAGTSGDAGSDGSGTYRRGGRVRRFQSGGRVMEAIDTGTSGPGSGYGYRAAPPARRY
jgi:hypothetical protein